MSPKLYLAILACLGLSPISAVPLNFLIQWHSNQTALDHTFAKPLYRPGSLHTNNRITCFKMKPFGVSLPICQPVLLELTSRPDVDFQHTYSAKAQERVKIVSGPCTISLYPSDVPGITVITYREITEIVRRILDRCEEERLGGEDYLGFWWYLEVLGGSKGVV